MGLLLEVKGAQISINTVEFGIIRGYEFRNSVPDSKYAKGYQDERPLIIKGSISRTLTKDPSVLGQIRKWAKIEYKDRKSYYHYAKITHTHRDELIRYIIFPDAFVSGYREEIDPHTGDGTYTLTLMQKLDKRIDIEVGPFNEEHPRLSDLMEKFWQEREAKRAVEAATLPQEEDILNSPPYWVQRRHLVSSNISIINPTFMYRGPSLRSGVFPNSLIQANANSSRMIIRARRDTNGLMWYLINNPPIGQGWVPASLAEGDFQGAATTEVARERANPVFMVVVADTFTDANGSPNSIRAVWGGTNSRPETVGQRQTPANFANTISADVNRGGAEQVGTSMGLVDGTVVQIMQSSNPIFSHEGTTQQNRWIKVRQWSAGARIVWPTGSANPNDDMIGFDHWVVPTSTTETRAPNRNRGFGGMLYWNGRWHMGSDFYGSTGQDVVAVADGIVMQVRERTNDQAVLIRHEGPFKVRGVELPYIFTVYQVYGTNDSSDRGIFVQYGQEVSAGQLIARNNANPLHFEVRRPSDNTPNEPSNSSANIFNNAEPIRWDYHIHPHWIFGDHTVTAFSQKP